jgi:hypothetical protein
MPSDFTGFDVLVTYIEEVDGVEMEREATVPGVTVIVRDVTDADPVTGVGAIALADLLADSSGHVAAGTAAVAAGRTLRFAWLRTLDGRCGSATQVTT